MTWNKHGLVAVAAITAMALAVSGCSGEGDDEPDGGSVTITFTGTDGPESYAPVIEAFESENPDITVEYNQIPQSEFAATMLQRLKAKDSSIDVFTVDQPDVAQFAASGVLSDMSEYAEQAKTAFPADQYEVNFFGDKMWALPVWTSTAILFYNKDAFTAAGVPFPSSDPEEAMTWEELRDVAEQVQKGAGLKSGFTFENPESYGSVITMAASAGGGTGITGDDGLTPDVDNDGWRTAMTWYSQLFEDGIAPRGTGEIGTDAYFASGNSAFIASGPWSVGGYLPGGWAEASIDWGVAPFPYFEGGERATWTGAWSWSYNPASEHKEAARKFIEFASLNADGNYKTVETTTIIPSQLEAAARYFPDIEKQAGDHGTGLADILTYQNDNTAVARPVSVGYVQFLTTMNAAVSDIVNGADPEDRLAQAQTELEDALEGLE